MQFDFPEWVLPNYPSLIREIGNRAASTPGFISFSLGNPASEAIPVEEIVAATEDAIQNHQMEILQYGPNTGYPPLLEQTCDWLQNVKKFPKENQMLILLSGSAQGLGIVPTVLCRPGDIAFCDEYAFPNFTNAARYAGCKLVGLAMDEQGMIPESLEEMAARYPGKLLYVNPNFQNPTGVTIPLERRKKIYEIACRYNLVIYEDDPYSEIRFRGEPIETFKQMDVDGRVIFAGSYSKTLSAGLRVGYLYGDQALLNPILRVKNNQLGQNPILNQMIISKTLDRMDFAAHLRKISKIYGDKCDAMIRAMQEYGPSEMKILIPDGGMFVWVTFPDSVDCPAIYKGQFEVGVGAVPSYGFAIDPERPWHSFRFNYTFQPEDTMRVGIQRFCDLSKQVIAQGK